MALTCSVAVPNACGKPGAELLVVETDNVIGYTAVRCADHPAADWRPIILRVSPRATMHVIPIPA